MAGPVSRRGLRESLLTWAPAVLLTIVGFVLAYQFVDPAPPDRLVMGTGEAGGAYRLFGASYQEILARERVTLELRASAGSLDNLRRLRGEGGGVDVAFIQGGTGKPQAGEGLLSLGSLYFEPIWVFYRDARVLDELRGLRGRRIAVGPRGSGTRAVATRLLAENGAEADSTTLLPLGGRKAGEALLAGRVDAAFFVASPRSPLVRELLVDERIRLMSLARAEAYTRLHGFLSHVVLPRGVIDLRRDIPAHDVQLLATTANLVIREDLHPAFIDLLLQAAREVHGGRGWFEGNGQFPSDDYLSFPLAKEARRFYTYGPSFLQRYLPFWAATLADRMKVMLLPLIALMLPLFKIMPPIYRWRMRSRIYRWYRELQAVDQSRETETGSCGVEECLAELARIEHEVARLNVPLSYTDELYDLRVHIALIRERLEEGASE